MQYDMPALGSDFSDWAQLTGEYAKGLEALRRRQPGASARMMEIARLMKQYSDVVGQQGIPPIRTQSELARTAVVPSTNWLDKAVQMFPRLGIQANRSSATLSY